MNIQLVPVFQFNLNHNILHGLVTVGKFDGKHPSLVCGTSSGKLFVHSSQDQSGRFLNIQQKIVSISCGKGEGDDHSDILYVGTPSNLLAYNVDQNSEKYYKDITDGLTAMITGSFSNHGGDITIVGGNCSIQAFSPSGEEAMWTVTGDVIGAMTLADVDGDGMNELIVGSDDYEIRIFKGEAVIFEITETDRISHLKNIKEGQYTYALSNGTIGLYNRFDRIWRAKLKQKVVSMIGEYDITMDGVPEVITGWSDGRFDVRDVRHGEVIYKETFSSPVSGFAVADYRSCGSPQLICCTRDGEVRGYIPIDEAQTRALYHHDVLLRLLSKKTRDFR
eukprot:TRINITY_DN9667_c0_g1_i1.p1 TRINITY_DN9667_c0_g1~~TRINITY_DN9667_c0_g1_i1.p1  ORF type:complete len:335 (+),score=75.94 TRINITY_DN9667_c0_g1_i1:107-1111(+)